MLVWYEPPQASRGGSSDYKSVEVTQLHRAMSHHSLLHPLGRRFIKTSYLEERRNTWQSAGITRTALQPGQTYLTLSLSLGTCVSGSSIQWSLRCGRRFHLGSTERWADHSAEQFMQDKYPQSRLNKPLALVYTSHQYLTSCSRLHRLARDGHQSAGPGQYALCLTMETKDH